MLAALLISMMTVVCTVGAAFASVDWAVTKHVQTTDKPDVSVSTQMIQDPAGRLFVCMSAEHSSRAKVWKAMCAPVVPQFKDCVETVETIDCSGQKEATR